MKDELQSQIKEQCRLNVPEGLKELMSDISREVLRAQPCYIYKFISDYLSALLVTRDKLSITAQVCTHLCECDCQETLLSELQQIGLDEADVEVACDVILKYLNKSKVCEGNLVAVLMKKTEIEPSKFPDVLNAVRAAYLRQQTLNTNNKEASSVIEDDEVTNAAAHTLNLYRQSRPTQEMYQLAAEKLRVSYRAYGVKREMQAKIDGHASPERSINVDNVQVDETEMNSLDLSISGDLKNELEWTASLLRNRISTVSSLSLAGSFCCLPKHKPYNAHDGDNLSELEENSEKENANIDYVTGTLHLSSTETNREAIKTNIANSFEPNDEQAKNNLGIDSEDRGETVTNKNGDEVIDECVTHSTDISNDVNEDIEEFLPDESDQSSSDFVPDEEINSERFDEDEDYIITDY